MELATARDPKTVNRLRASLCNAVGVDCKQVAVFIRGPGNYLDVMEITTEPEAKKIVKDVNVRHPASGYRAFVRPLRFELAE
jgi:hypothetical protein